MSGPNDPFDFSNSDAADVLGGGHPKSLPVDVAFGMDDGGLDDTDPNDDGCDCDPLLDDNCDCGD